MAVLRTWASSSSTNLNDGSNYSPTGPLLSSDDLLFTNTSVIDATVTANVSVNSITADASYTGGLFFNHYTGVLNGDRSGYSLYLSGAGNRHFGDNLTFNGNSSTVYLGAGTKAFDATNCDMTFNGLNQQLISYKNVTVKSLTVTNGNRLAVSGDGTLVITKSVNTPFLRLGSDSTFTNNASLAIIPNNTGSAGNFTPLNFSGNYVFNGSGPVLLDAASGSGSFTLNIPTLNYTGTGTWTNDIVPIIFLSGPVNFGGSFINHGTQRFNSPITFTGSDSTFQSVHSGASIDATNCSVTFNGQRSYMIMNTIDRVFKSLTLNSSASLSIGGSYPLYFRSDSTPLVMGNDSTLTKTGNDLIGFGRTTSGPMHSIGTGCSIVASSGYYSFLAMADDVTCTFPAFNFPNVPLTISSSSLATTPRFSGINVKLAGDVTCSEFNIYPGQYASGTFDLNDYSVYALGAFQPGSLDTYSGHDSTIKYGSGTLTIGSYRGDTNGGSGRHITEDLENCRINCYGNWINSGFLYATFNPGTSYIKLFPNPSSSSISIKTENKSFYDFEIATASDIVNCTSEDFRAHDFTITSGRWSNGTQSIYLTGNLRWDSTGTYDFGYGLTMNGNSKSAFFNSAMGTISGYATVVNWNGLDGTWVDNKGIDSFGSLVLGPGVKLLSNGSAITTFFGVIPLTMDSSTHLTLNAPVSFSIASTSSAYRFNLSNPYIIDGTSPIETIFSVNSDMNMPALTYSGTGLWTMKVVPSARVNFTGALNFGGGLILQPLAFSSYGGNFNLYGPTLTFPNNDSTLSLIERPTPWSGPIIDASNCSLIYNGKRCALTDNNRLDKVFKNLTLGSDATVIKNGLYETNFQDTTNPLILESGSRLKLDASTGFYLTSSGTPYSIASSATIDGTSVLTFGLNSNDITGSIPNLRYIGTGPVNFIDGTATRTGMLWNQESNLNLSNSGIGIFSTQTGSRASFYCNSYDMTCVSLRTGKDASSDFTLNWGLGTRSINNYDGTTHNFATGTYNQIFNRSNFVCSRNWSYGSNHNIILVPGNYTLKVTGDSTLTSNGKFFNFVEINAPDSTVTLNDNFKCHGYKKTVGTLNANGKKFEITGDFQSPVNF